MQMMSVRAGLWLAGVLLCSAAGARADLRVSADFPVARTTVSGPVTGQLVAQYRQDVARMAPGAKPAPLRKTLRP